MNQLRLSAHGLRCDAEIQRLKGDNTTNSYFECIIQSTNVIEMVSDLSDLQISFLERILEYQSNNLQNFVFRHHSYVNNKYRNLLIDIEEAKMQGCLYLIKMITKTRESDLIDESFLSLPNVYIVHPSKPYLLKKEIKFLEKSFKHALLLF